jgi:DNA-binding NarL/FixJ family response regulator
VQQIHNIVFSTDEPIVEMGVRSLLEADPQFKLLEVCRTHNEVIQATTRFQPDIVVCGLRETDLSGIREIQAAAPHAAIVLWAREVSAELAHQAVELGVRGFLSTQASPQHFRECLQIAARGELWMESSLTMNILSNRPVSLSKRQSELVALLVQGLKNKEIAATLGISEGTVKAYLTTLYEKVGARDRFELALFGLKNMGELRGAGRGAEAKPAESLRSLVGRRGYARRSEA